ncbi:MAG: DUF554 domain-containing protein [Desulfosarcinaceae bacterium]
METIPLLGTLVNAAAIIAGGLIGLMVRGGIRENYRHTLMQAIALAVILIGLRGALGSQDLLLVIVSLALGTLAGEYLQIEERLLSIGKGLEGKLAFEGQSIAHGFVTASLVFCVGAMAVVGSLESGLAGNHQTLYAKSILDGLTSVIFASTLGLGVLFSAFSVLIYQGCITLAAGFIQKLLIDSVVLQMSSVGGLLIAAIGINLLEIKKIRVGNMLPAIFVPLAYYALKQLVVRF